MRLQREAIGLLLDKVASKCLRYKINTMQWAAYTRSPLPWHSEESLEKSRLLPHRLSQEWCQPGIISRSSVIVCTWPRQDSQKPLPKKLPFVLPTCSWWLMGPTKGFSADWSNHGVSLSCPSLLCHSRDFNIPKKDGSWCLDVQTPVSPYWVFPPESWQPRRGFQTSNLIKYGC